MQNNSTDKLMKAVDVYYTNIKLCIAVCSEMPAQRTERWCGDCCNLVAYVLD